MPEDFKIANFLLNYQRVQKLLGASPLADLKLSFYDTVKIEELFCKNRVAGK